MRQISKLPLATCWACGTGSGRCAAEHLTFAGWCVNIFYAVGLLTNGGQAGRRDDACGAEASRRPPVVPSAGGANRELVKRMRTDEMGPFSRQRSELLVVRSLRRSLQTAGQLHGICVFCACIRVEEYSTLPKQLQTGTRINYLAVFDRHRSAPWPISARAVPREKPHHIPGAP